MVSTRCGLVSFLPNIKVLSCLQSTLLGSRSMQLEASIYFLQIKWAVCKFIGSCRGVVSQSVERPSKVWRNSTALTWVRITRETFFHLSLSKEAKVISLLLLSPRYKVVGNNHSKNLATPSVDERRSKSEFWDKKKSFDAES